MTDRTEKRLSGLGCLKPNKKTLKGDLVDLEERHRQARIILEDLKAQLCLIKSQLALYRIKGDMGRILKSSDKLRSKELREALKVVEDVNSLEGELKTIEKMTDKKQKKTEIRLTKKPSILSADDMVRMYI